MTTHSVDLFWLPLGAGGWVVRRNGWVYERLVARHQRREPLDLYHAALEVHADSARYVVEMAPVWSLGASDRGAVSHGPVGTAWLGRFRAFQYEVRCWRDGVIPDREHAVGGSVRVSTDAARALALLDALSRVPVLTWGRDPALTHDMWNSNSVVSWALTCSGHDAASLMPPPGGRAPGWAAGLRVAEL